MLTARGDSSHDAVGANHHDRSGCGPSGDVETEPAATVETGFGRQDWLDLMKPMGPPVSPGASRLKRWGAMSVTIAAIAVGIVTFSTGEPVSGFNLAADLPPQADPLSSSAIVDDDDTDIDGSEQTLETALSGADNEFRTMAMLDPGGSRLEVRSGDDQADQSTTSPVPETTATNRGWAEPHIEPESAWVDAGHGIAVPDVLLRIRFCESTNDYQAAHATSSARGAYQFLTGSWDWYGHAARYGVASADMATPAQQDEAAVATLRRSGTRPWRASWRCWGSDSINPAYATIKRRRAATTTTAAPSTTSSSGTESSTTTSDASTTATTGTTSTTPSPTSSTTTQSSTSSSTEASTTTGSTATSSTGT